MYGYVRGHNGQGMTEYAVILALIVSMGVGMYESSGFSSAVDSLYGTIAVKLSTAVGYDTGKTFTTTNGATTEIWHETTLSYPGTTAGKDYTIYWFINSDGNKEYKVGMSSRGAGNSLQAYSGGTSYFKASDGNIYQIVENGGNTTIELYTGSTANIGANQWKNSISDNNVPNKS